MKVLVVGSGGREHALAWKLSHSDLVDEVLVAPGNAGTAVEPNVRNVDIDPSDFDVLCDWVEGNSVGLTVVGPEQPLTEGIRDAFDAHGLRCLAPSKAASQLEGSKAFAKEFMTRHGIPTAGSLITAKVEEAVDYIKQRGAPIVVKADGLAAGKGVTVARTTEEAIEAVDSMLSGRSFGEAGEKVVIEDFLEGEEASFMLLADGANVLSFASSQDHKAVFDGDQGPNTGGMGAYSPAPVVTQEVSDRVMRQIVEPTMAGLAAEGMPFQGFLYVGLMIDASGNPHVVEYNCRFGDPEAQPIMVRLKSDLAAFCLDALDGNLAGKQLEFEGDATVGIVLASEGYPGDYVTGLPISGLDHDGADVKTFHAGTSRSGDAVVTDGGRVLCVVGKGADVRTAQRVAYNRIREISWDGMQYRSDIAYRAIARL